MDFNGVFDGIIQDASAALAAGASQLQAQTDALQATIDDASKVPATFRDSQIQTLIDTNTVNVAGQRAQLKLIQDSVAELNTIRQLPDDAKEFLFALYQASQASVTEFLVRVPFNFRTFISNPTFAALYQTPNVPKASKDAVVRLFFASVQPDRVHGPYLYGVIARAVAAREPRPGQ